MIKTNPTITVNEILKALTYVADIHGNKKLFHSWRVAILSARLAKNITNSRILKEIFYAGLLHDIGGVGFPFHILHYLKKEGNNNQNILLSHPIIGAQLVSNIPMMTEVAKLIIDHHEWVDGRGYPRAKLKDQIPLGSQVIRISDAVDIILQARPKCILKELKGRVSLNIGREYTKEMFKRAFDTLGEPKFFSRLTSESSVTALFEETQNKVGFINIPQKIDAIGTTLEVVAQIIDMRHPYTSGHSLRVSRYAMACALAMNLPHDEVTRIKWAGLIHDIGKIVISRKILEKPVNLTQEEFHKVKKHAVFTKRILGMITSLKELTPIAVNHHEYYDGSGYPQGLKGKEIPEGARIMVICDAFDAMTSNRPYRKPFTPNEACEEIEKQAGRQFDPEIVKKTIPIFKNLGL